MLTIEFEPPKNTTCDCCGGVTTTLTRFVSQDGDAYAIYYARFGAEHRERVVQAVVSLGDWSDAAGPWDRVAFPLEIRAAEAEYRVGLANAADSPWSGTAIIGRVLDRDEALQHERLSEVFHITDHMVRDDVPLREYLDGAA